MPLGFTSTSSLPPAPTIPPVDVTVWHGLAMQWEGWDGSVWDLTDYTSGVFLTADGLTGLHFGPGQSFVSTSPVMHGATFRGWIADQRPVLWPVLVWSDTGSQGWLDLDGAFHRSFAPDVPGTWTVTLPSGEQRSLRLRLDDDGSAPYDADPVKRGWNVYGVKLVADQPFWEGAPEKRTWKAATAAPFNVPVGGGGVLYISASGGFGNATIPNRGQVAAAPVWTLTGPLSSASLGVGGGTIDVPFALGENESLILDARPDRQTAITDGGVDRTGDLGIAEWRSVPPGDEVPVTIAMDGGAPGASVELSLTPLFRRALG